MSLSNIFKLDHVNVTKINAKNVNCSTKMEVNICINMIENKPSTKAEIDKHVKKV
tara:strand:+ start:2346 stop:2510 length:165 start_codon:yes stop_codon:yes gene_type:complete